MRKGLDVRHLLIYEVHDLVEGLEHIQAFKILALRDLRVERGVEVEDRRVHAADLKEFLALEAGLRDVLRQAVAVDARSHRHAELARVGEAHWFTAAGLLALFCSQRLLWCGVCLISVAARVFLRPWRQFNPTTLAARKTLEKNLLAGWRPQTG